MKTKRMDSQNDIWTSETDKPACKVNAIRNETDGKTFIDK